MAPWIAGHQATGKELRCKDGTGTTFQWYRADDAAGTNEASIKGAVGEFYTPNENDVGKYLRCDDTGTYTPYVGPINQGAAEDFVVLMG